MRRLPALLIASIVALLVAASPAPAMEPGVVQSGNFPADEATVVEDMGAGWVRMWARYSQGCPLPAHEAARLDAYEQRNVKVLIVGVGGSAGDAAPPRTPEEYASWMACLASTYGSRIDALEIWNEPDEKVFWSTGPDPAAYTAVLKASYTAIKAVRDMPVIVGGLTGNNFRFLEAVYANGGGGSFDAVGVHTDTACLISDPHDYYREPDGRIGRFSFTGFREVHHVMAANGDADKQVWMTEIGWSTLTSKCTHPGVTVDRPSGVSQDKQAEFLGKAYACAAAESYVGPVLWFSLRDHGTEDQYDHHLGLMDASGTPKKSFYAFRGLFGPGGTGVTPNPNCGAKLDKDPPTVTLDVPQQYYSRLVVAGSATDPTTPVSRMELWVDGKRVEGANQEGGAYHRDWFGSTNLSYGTHTIELRAYDEAQNVGRASARVRRINPSDPSGGAVRTADARLAYKAKQRKNGKVAVKARVLRALAGDFTEEPRGRLRIFFDRKAGRKWKRYSRYTKGISRPIKLVYTPRRAGRWRVVAKLVLDAPYRNRKAKPYYFRAR